MIVLLILLLDVQTLLPLCSAFVVDRHATAAKAIGISQFPSSSQPTRKIDLSTTTQITTIGNRRKSAGPTNNKVVTMISTTTTTTTTSTTPTQLMLHPTAGASLALVGSSLFGMQISKFVPSGGILGTLLSAAFFGNVLTKWIPNQHPLYDLCFTLFLPGSLTLLLLAYQPPKKDLLENSNVAATGRISATTTSPSQNSIAACIRRIAMPFVITSLASLLGCWLSYRCALAFRWFQKCSVAGLTGAAANAGTGSKAASELARITTGCMSASYVGGSVNFVSTARLIGAPAELLGSLVTADLFTMAIYFSFLSSSLDWEWLVSKFSYAATTTNHAVEQKKYIENDMAQQQASKDNKTDLESQREIMSSSSSSSLVSSDRNSVCLASVPLLISTFLIVQGANRIENVLGKFVPGTACAVIAIVAPILNSLVKDKDFWTPFSKAASVWSDFFFLSFFASIGVAANLSSALSMGPACLLFSAIALVVHVLGTVFGCLLWKRVVVELVGHFGGENNSDASPPSLDLEDVWIASNAAIGGPATAAAFCGQMKKRDPDKLQGRTISATVWGVVGYAIGTMVGVSMYRII